MRNMKVAAKLITGFAIISVLTIIVGTVGIYGMSRIEQGSKRMYENNLLAAQAMGDIREAFQQERVYFRDMLIYIDYPDIVNANIENVNKSHLIGDAAVRDYMGMITDESLESAFIEAGGLLDGPYFDAKEKIMQSARAGDAQGVLEGIEDAAAYVSTIENDLVISERSHVTRASEQYAANVALSRNLTIMQIIVIVVVCLIAMFLGIYISRLINKPLIPLTVFMNKAGETGDISLNEKDVEIVNTFSRVEDEIGQCVTSCAKFIARLMEINKAMEDVANGDLTGEFTPLSDKDTMGVSLEKMFVNLNHMFSEINKASEQVATSSEEIAQGSQDLAQGSTEQASVVEQLFASISEVAESTNTNAEMAKEAASLSGTIRNNAEKGSLQMDQLMQSVREINEASSSISKVIRVIDDIAFQTNILALNAAIESARAGQHGRGFAVVAEEVRSLAAKSAEAAKDTSNMIENSIEKANLGLAIATDTTASLKDIVEGIGRSAENIDRIARSSEEQARSITQINVGIDQVAQAAQQTSATAEESAAASDEMSGQADTLSRLISQFKLKAAD